MKTTSTSSVGSARAASARPWTPVAKRDTTPEVAARQDAWWAGLSGPDRARWWMQYQEMIAIARRNLIKKQHPGASDGEVVALWVEETYRGRADTNPLWLAKACAAIRGGGTGSEVGSSGEASPADQAR